MRIVALVVTVFVIAFPKSASADSDGYYCAGRGFLAYEQRVAAPRITHELRIVYFESGRSIEAAPPVILEDFQVHGMRCRPGIVELVGAGTGAVVTFSNRAGPPIVTRASTSMIADRAPALANLGHWSQSGVFDLDAEGSDLFQLVIAKVSQRVERGVERHTVSRVIRRGGAGGAIVQALTVFEGVSKETAN